MCDSKDWCSAQVFVFLMGENMSHDYLHNFVQALENPTGKCVGHPGITLSENAMFSSNSTTDTMFHCSS